MGFCFVFKPLKKISTESFNLTASISTKVNDFSSKYWVKKNTTTVLPFCSWSTGVIHSANASNLLLFSPIQHSGGGMEPIPAVITRAGYTLSSQLVRARPRIHKGTTAFTLTYTIFLPSVRMT